MKLRVTRQPGCRYVRFIGRLGNNLFQLSAGLHTYGAAEDGTLNFKACYRGEKHKLLLRYMLPRVELVPASQMQMNGSLPLGGMGCHYFMHPDFLVPPDTMRKYIRIDPPDARYDCVVHLRGTDYRSLAGYRDCVVPRHYVLEGLKRCGVAPKDAVVCTDDPELAAHTLPEARVCEGTLFGGAPADFSRMVHAHNLIMSPSSFAWWTGYLGEQEKVIYPDRWPYAILNMYNSETTMCKDPIQLTFDRCEVVSSQRS